MIYFQQGDCLIKQVNQIPDNATSKEDRILVEGEHTGHAHRVAGRTAMLYLVGLTCYLRTFEDTPIEHEEHRTIVLPPGDWQIDRVQEFDHFKEEARRVMD
jgi:hypothetical protein